MNNVVNVPVPGSPRFQQDTAMAIARLRAALGPEGSPTFGAITLPVSVTGIIKATAGVLSGGGTHSDLAGVTADQHHAPVTVADSSSIHLALSGQQVTATLFDGVIIDCGASNTLLDTDFSFDGGYSL